MSKYRSVSFRTPNSIELLLRASSVSLSPAARAVTTYMLDARQSPTGRLILSLVVSMLSSFVGLVLVRCVAPASWLHANNEVAGNYLQTLGTIYAVLLAFVVFVVWQQHNETRCAVEKEANELSDLYRIIQALPATQRVQDCIQAYGRIVVDEEWEAMARGSWSEKAEQALEQIWQVLRELEPPSGRDATLYSEALAKFNDLSDGRSHRLFCSLLRLPPSLWLLLLTNGGLVIGSMWIFGLESFSAHALMTVALAGSIGFILFLVADLDNPFWGSWRVGPDAFKQALGTKQQQKS